MARGSFIGVGTLLIVTLHSFAGCRSPDDGGADGRAEAGTAGASTVGSGGRAATAGTGGVATGGSAGSSGSAGTAPAGGSSSGGTDAGDDAGSTKLCSANRAGSVMKVPIEGGEPVVIAADQNDPRGIAIDATAVYWANGGDGTVMSAPLAGGSASTFATTSAGVSGVVVDSEAVYWAIEGGSMAKRLLSGGSVVALGPVPVRFTLAADTTHLYAVDHGSMHRVPKAGGAAERISIALEGNPLNDAWGVATDADYAYWTAVNAGGLSSSGFVGRTSKLGTAAVLLATREPTPFGIAVDSSGIYWTTFHDGNGGGGTVTRLSAGDRGALERIARGQNVPLAIALDAANVYFTSFEGGGAIYKLPKAGGAPTVVASGQACPWSIAVDATHVYWTNFGRDPFD